MLLVSCLKFSNFCVTFYLRVLFWVFFCQCKHEECNEVVLCCKYLRCWNQFQFLKTRLDNIVLAFTITETCGIHLHLSYKYILSQVFNPGLLASLYFMIICACMLIPRYIAWSVNEVFSSCFAFSFPAGIKPLFVGTREFCCVCKARYSWRWNSFLLGEKT